MPVVSEDAMDNHRDMDRTPYHGQSAERRSKGHYSIMPKTPRNGTPARDNQAATLWADLGKGARSYRRIKRDEWLDFEERQYYRRLAVEKIEAAPLVGETVDGFHWKTAWIIVQTMLFIDNRQDEMMVPEDWYESKRSTRTN